MLALLSVWIGLFMAALAGAMLLYRPLFSDRLVPVVLYGSVLAMTLGGLVLWSHRKEPSPEPGIAAQRTQSRVGIGLALAAVVVIYFLVANARQAPR